jgi:acyl-CoA synthetase (NDP forming)
VSLKNSSGRELTDDLQHTGFVLEPEAVELLSNYQVPYPAHGLAHSSDEVVEIAERLGYPVVLKIVSPDVIHKSDAGGVLVGIADREQARDGYNTILDSVVAHLPGTRIEGILVCKQAPVGLEVIVGSLDDPMFGPTIMFGMGGIFAEVLRDVVFRLAPLSRLDALEMVREVKGYPLIAGLRGQKTRDEEALVDLLLAISQLVTEHGEIKELDLNPVCLYEQGLLVLDVRVITTTSHITNGEFRNETI